MASQSILKALPFAVLNDFEIYLECQEAIKTKYDDVDIQQLLNNENVIGSESIYTTDCNYYGEEAFKIMIDNNLKMGVFLFNVRRLAKQRRDITTYLAFYNIKYDVILNYTRKLGKEVNLWEICLMGMTIYL